MVADQPPDVRDRAAQAACLTFYGGEGAELLAPGPGWRAVVDAVAEVLAAEQPERRHKIPTDAEMESAAVKFINQDLAIHRVTQEREALKARVDLLTAALTELVDIVDASSYLTALSNNDHDRVEIARAVLAATPTEDKS